jgi:MoxR-like ATPase
MLAVNAAITLKRPLLVKGEPGTGKTMLAEEVAQALDMPLLQWHIKSTTKAQQGLYEYDAVNRLRHLLGQHGLAGARFALDEQRAFERDGGVHGQHQVLGGDVVFRALELHGGGGEGRWMGLWVRVINKPLLMVKSI